ncbi:hypothetical protein HDU92_005569 [Lobulomyces angularis]|nr:hypothetical protein HDU92_005569 [Lobulomyces angularis]
MFFKQQILIYFVLLLSLKAQDDVVKNWLKEQVEAWCNGWGQITPACWVYKLGQLPWNDFPCPKEFLKDDPNDIRKACFDWGHCRKICVNPPSPPVNPPTDPPVNPPTDPPVNPPTDPPVNPPTDPNTGCNNDNECPGELVCRNRQCVTFGSGGCGSDNDCPGELVCKSGQCVGFGTGGCNSDNECAGEKVCKNHQCVDFGTGPCTSNDQCPGDKVCKNQQCVIFGTGPCRSNDECAGEKICKNQKCVDFGTGPCNSDDECAGDKVCKNQQCIIFGTGPCQSNDECSGEKICKNQKCVDFGTGPCNSDDECAGEKICKNQQCIDFGTGPCQSDNDCAGENVCKNGICSPFGVGPCSSHDDCAGDDVCKDGVCGKDDSDTCPFPCTPWPNWDIHIPSIPIPFPPPVGCIIPCVCWTCPIPPLPITPPGGTFFPNGGNGNGNNQPRTVTVTSTVSTSTITSTNSSSTVTGLHIKTRYATIPTGLFMDINTGVISVPSSLPEGETEAWDLNCYLTERFTLIKCDYENFYQEGNFIAISEDKNLNTVQKKFCNANKGSVTFETKSLSVGTWYIQLVNTINEIKVELPLELDSSVFVIPTNQQPTITPIIPSPTSQWSLNCAQVQNKPGFISCEYKTAEVDANNFVGITKDRNINVNLKKNCASSAGVVEFDIKELPLGQWNIILVNRDQIKYEVALSTAPVSSTQECTWDGFCVGDACFDMVGCEFDVLCKNNDCFNVAHSKKTERPSIQPKCKFSGYCKGANCVKYNGCNLNMLCQGGNCIDFVPPVAPVTTPWTPLPIPPNLPACSWPGHCFNDVCVSNNQCDGDLVCGNGHCANEGATTNSVSCKEINRTPQLDMDNDGKPLLLGSGPKDHALKSCTGELYEMTDRATYLKAQMEGTLKLRDGRVINLPSTGSIECFDIVPNTKFGLGSRSNHLEPFISVAVNQPELFGKTIYIRELDGAKMMNNDIHNGCVRVDDSGWSFSGCQIDFMVGTFPNYMQFAPDAVVATVANCKLKKYSF